MSDTTTDSIDGHEYRHIALAAVTQCAHLVHELASNGEIDRHQLSACVEPLLVLDAQHTRDIYPRINDFQPGLRILEQCFDSEGLRKNQEVIRYLVGMLVLQKRLQKLPQMQQTIRQRLQQLRHSRQLDTDTALSTDEFKRLSQLYQDTLSTLNFRIHVAGNPQHLREQHNANRIRALLLAGIRSAMLWHHLGGRRWQLFFAKKRIRREVNDLRRRLMAGDAAGTTPPQRE